MDSIMIYIYICFLSRDAFSAVLIWLQVLSKHQSRCYLKHDDGYNECIRFVDWPCSPLSLDEPIPGLQVGVPDTLIHQACN